MNYEYLLFKLNADEINHSKYIFKFLNGLG